MLARVATHAVFEELPAAVPEFMKTDLPWTSSSNFRSPKVLNLVIG